MKIAVFGGTGGTGKNVLRRALAAGHDVVAVARRPEAIEAKDERLTVAKGDVTDRASFERALAGVEAVISAIGPPSLVSPGTLLSVGTKNLVDACVAQGVRRFVLESGIIAGDAAELSALPRFMIGFGHMALGGLYREKVAAEETVRASSLDYVIVRPVGLAHTPASGSYKVGPGVEVSLAKSLSHDDVAEFMVKAAGGAEFSRQIVNIGH